ncbi:hypothetical protein FDP41_008556 [Naegleria fowleri]|uniref:Uncharacterized protein n=1 Tax=Naegleria fowleri TaxID=5763 RepID=A0A6A5BKH1_NAEFO|nr:uncharacterized protein FDP41_008556 [Naegleria fowleri]KAF0973349.1 hypothetical protein FDP41_008556 [Naegleria fowleri]
MSLLDEVTSNTLNTLNATSCPSADRLVKKAENVLSKKLHFGNRNKDAQKYYEQAAEIYMQSNMYSMAGEAYMKSGECFEALGEPTRAANTFSVASEAFMNDAMFDHSKDTFEKSLHALQRASVLYNENGQTAQAARKEKAIAEKLSEESITDIDILHLAIEAYRRAAELFEFQQAYATVNACLEQIGYLYVRVNEYVESSKVWEEILNSEWNRGNSTTGQSSLIRHLETKYMFYSLLTRLAGMKEDYDSEDLDSFWMELENFEERGQSFGKSREFELLVGVYQAFKERDLKVFLRVVKKTLEVAKLDEWSKQILLHIRKKLENAIHCSSIDEDEDGEVDLT